MGLSGRDHYDAILFGGFIIIFNIWNHIFISWYFQDMFTGWWFGTFFIFPYIGNILPTDFHIFQRGWNHQPVHHFQFPSLPGKVIPVWTFLRSTCCGGLWVNRLKFTSRLNIGYPARVSPHFFGVKPSINELKPKGNHLELYALVIEHCYWTYEKWFSIATSKSQRVFGNLWI